MIFTPASITVSVGSETVSENTVCAIPAAFSGARHLSIRPVPTITLSETISGRERPNLPSSSAICATEPPPISMKRGAAMVVVFTVDMRVPPSVAKPSAPSPAGCATGGQRQETRIMARSVLVDYIDQITRSNATCAGTGEIGYSGICDCVCHILFKWPVSRIGTAFVPKRKTNSALSNMGSAA